MEYVFSFEDFLRHVVWTHENGLPDKQWISIYVQCHPCLYHYEYVAHLESAKEVRALLHLAHFQGSDSDTFPFQNVPKANVRHDALIF